MLEIIDFRSAPDFRYHYLLQIKLRKEDLKKGALLFKNSLSLRFSLEYLVKTGFANNYPFLLNLG